jgi:hypothetical protein
MCLGDRHLILPTATLHDHHGAQPPASRNMALFLFISLLLAVLISLPTFIQLSQDECKKLV